MAAVGIDLGTSYCCIGVWKENRVQIISNEEGNMTTPSYVSFWGSEADMMIGEGAKYAAPSNPSGTVFDSRRLIGKKFSDKFIRCLIV